MSSPINPPELIAAGIASFQQGREKVIGALDALDDLAQVPDPEPSDWRPIAEEFGTAFELVKAGAFVVSNFAAPGSKELTDAYKGAGMIAVPGVLVPMLDERNVPTSKWAERVRVYTDPGLELVDKSIRFLSSQIAPESA